MAKPSPRGDARSFRGAFTVDEVRKAAADAALPFLSRYNVEVTCGNQPAYFAELHSFNGRKLAKALREEFRTMSGFGLSIAQAALNCALASGFPKAIIYNITVAVTEIEGAAMVEFSYKVALLKE